MRSASLISIASKYVLRVKGRHLWNPSNFGVSAVLFLAPATVSLLSIQWGNTLWPMVVIWLLGLGDRLARRPSAHQRHIRGVVSRVSRSSAARITGNPWLANVAPITGPMYQLFIFFMVTDPKTTVAAEMGARCVVVFVVALVEMVLRLNEIVYAPFYALFLVGPTAMIVESLFAGPAVARRRS